MMNAAEVAEPVRGFTPEAARIGENLKNDVIAEAKDRSRLMQNEARRQAVEKVEARVAERAKAREEQRIENQKVDAEIAYGYSEEAQAENLRDKVLQIVELSPEVKTITATESARIEKMAQKNAIKYITDLVKKFGIFGKYSNANAGIEFDFSKNGLLKESSHKHMRRSGDMNGFTKMLFGIDSLAKNAVPIETHNDKYIGTRRDDKTLNRIYVLLSAFKDGEYVVPVQLEVKEFIDKENKLYMALTLKKTEAVGLGAETSFEISSAATTSDISVPELIQKNNPSDGDFLKYILEIRYINRTARMYCAILTFIRHAVTINIGVFCHLQLQTQRLTGGIIP